MARTRNQRDRRHRWKLGLAGSVLACIALGVQLRPAGDLGTSRYDGHLDQSRRRDPFVKPWRWESGAPIQDLSRGVLAENGEVS
jgi:hypothetical protein